MTDGPAKKEMRYVCINDAYIHTIFNSSIRDILQREIKNDLPNKAEFYSRKDR